MAIRFQMRGDLAAVWELVNPVLAEREIGFVTDDNSRYKLGDGIHAWNDLPYRGWTGNVAVTMGDSDDVPISLRAFTLAIAGLTLNTDYTESEFESLEEKDLNTLYICSED